MLKIELLSKHHDRSNFDCGNDNLNNYLKQTARQHIIKGISKTYVIVDDINPTEIIGFYTLCSCEILTEKLPLKYANKYPSRVPGVKLARLAVSVTMQRKGHGKLMMVDGIRRVILVSEQLGITGFFVDAKDDDAKAYYKQYNFIELPDNPLELFLPVSMFIDSFKGPNK